MLKQFDAVGAEGMAAANFGNKVRSPSAREKDRKKVDKANYEMASVAES